MPATGAACTQSGLLRQRCHAKQIALSTGETFPRAQAATGPPIGGEAVAAPLPGCWCCQAVPRRPRRSGLDDRLEPSWAAASCRVAVVIPVPWRAATGRTNGGDRGPARYRRQAAG
jgi:hypothetical protein